MYLRQAFLVIKRNAGHSKWQNIRHTKGEKDRQKSMMYVKLCYKIRVAIQENGNNSNPATNNQLQHAIEYARKQDMTAATIQSCIKSTQVDKELAKSQIYSIKGPKGSVLLVTALTTAPKKTKQQICGYLNKVGGIMSEQSLEGNLFDKKGLIVAIPPTDVDNIEEVSVEHAIEVEAEEVLPLDEEKNLSFLCDAGQLHKVKKKLEDLKYKIEDAKFTYVPKMKVSLDDNDLELMAKIMQKLGEHPEVVEFNDNIE